MQVHVAAEKLPTFGTENFIRRCACLIDLKLLTLAEALTAEPAPDVSNGAPARDVVSMRYELFNSHN